MGLLLLIGVHFSNFAQASFTISGSVPDAIAGKTLYLEREDIEAKSLSIVAEVASASNGDVLISVDAEPGIYSLVLPDGARIALAIAQGQSLTLTPDPSAPDHIRISGSPDTERFRAYESFRKDSLARLVYPPRAALNEATARGADPETLAILSKQEVDGYAAHRRELNDFSLDHVGESIALYMTSLRWDPDYRLEELAALVNRFQSIHPGIQIAESMTQRIDSFQRTAIGAAGAPLAGKNLDGSELTLESFRGKITLVDFWASWCVPCRVENRLYGTLLEAYADEEFAIFAVNLDDSRVAWATASKRDKVAWPQISDSLGWKSSMAAAYNVSALPMSFLLDAEGRIIARNLRGEALEAKLEALFK